MKYFKLSEFTKSATAVKNGIDNSIDDAIVVDNLYNLVENVLDPLRALTGAPIYVNSGYRCRELNTIVGGSRTSQHLTGCAADITSDDNKRLVYLLLNYLSFDQAIIYRNGSDIRFVHVSYISGTDNRREVIWKK